MIQKDFIFRKMFLVTEYAALENCCAIFNDMVLIAMWQEGERIDNTVIIHELELAIKRSL